MRAKAISVETRRYQKSLVRLIILAALVAAELLTVQAARAEDVPAHVSPATSLQAATAAEAPATAAAPDSAAAEISRNELARRLQDEPHDFMVLDVRTAEEFAQGHVPGAINIPLDQLAARTPELKADGEIVVYCLSGGRAQQAIDLLRQRDFKQVTHLSGDYPAWQGTP